jgi:hypothetical protein
MKQTMFCVLLFFVCAASAQQVSVNYNHNQSFANYHTHAWASNNPNQIQNSILAQSVHQDINNALQEKGLMMVQETQHPDLIVVTSNGLRQQTSYDAWGMRGIGGVWGESLLNKARKES